MIPYSHISLQKFLCCRFVDKLHARDLESSAICYLLLWNSNSTEINEKYLVAQRNKLYNRNRTFSKEVFEQFIYLAFKAAFPAMCH